MIKKGLTILLLIFFVGCSNKDITANITDDTEEETNDIIATTTDNTPVKKEPLPDDKTIDLSVDNEIIEIDTEEIPILSYFLSTFENKQIGINTMTLEELEIENLYLLSFNCNINNCSYLLLDQNNPKRSMLLNDFVHLKSIVPSPSEEDFLIIFEHRHSDEMVIFNLDKWRKKNFEQNLKEFGEIRLSNPEWINQNEFSVDILQSEANNMQKVTFTKAEEEIIEK
ncbi:hypothetical protein F9U64_02935 [Gracilibacillus oryzae]|uniref:Lipoprotein n=1 Tax=Gracilibacillus oryzae TaxID=1672701 RepID=A0A7C8KTM0_9BACI|nr:hypothetical protein [Gracilibacillus oryzae]KAB8138587.1 hypothetical protein F9U64_02935 [Gracilibacillus oryzae]